MVSAIEIVADPVERLFVITMEPETVVAPRVPLKTPLNSDPDADVINVVVHEMFEPEIVTGRLSVQEVAPSRQVKLAVLPAVAVEVQLPAIFTTPEVMPFWVVVVNVIVPLKVLANVHVV